MDFTPRATNCSSPRNILFHNRKQLTCVTFPFQSSPLISPAQELYCATLSSFPLLHAAVDDALHICISLVYNLSFNSEAFHLLESWCALSSTEGKDFTNLHNPHQQSYTLIPLMALGSTTSVHPASLVCISCDAVPLE